MKFACFGDSITSEEVSGIGTLVCRNLQAELVGNFAHGNATCADWHLSGENLTKPCLEVPFDHWGSINTLSNQILKFETLGENADIAYIAISGNDGRNEETSILEEETADRITIYGALCSAVKRLRAVNPEMRIFLATPIKASGTTLPEAFSQEALETKSKIVRKAAEDSGVILIDSQKYAPFDGHEGADELGIHPIGEKRQEIADFVSDQIQKYLV